MKHLLLIITLTLLCVSGFAQSNVSFGYDTNGNRTSRGILFGRVTENGKSVESESALLSVATDQIGDIELALFPNPTRDRTLRQSTILILT